LHQGAFVWGDSTDADFGSTGNNQFLIRANGGVGIGTASPGALLHVFTPNQTPAVFESPHTGGTWLGLQNNGGGRRWSLITTGTGNGEGAGHLLFYASGVSPSQKVIFRDDGRVGIGTTAPGDMLEVQAADPSVRIQNVNDGGLGGFVENTYGALQFGMFSETGVFNQVPAAGKRAFFGFKPDGRVGSLVNVLTGPSDASFRNLLDDGAGNMSVTDTGGIYFGATTRQMINLYWANYGIGVQNNTFYCRTDGNFAWYRFGSHSNGELSAGGGSTLMTLTPSGLTVNGAFVSSSDRNVKTAFVTVEPREVLNKVAALPVHTWSFTNDVTTRHIGPMAQDFHAAFAVGSDDKHIATVDADGVALAAIQGLNQKLEAEVAERAAQILALEKRVANLERLLQQLVDAATPSR
jgi:hypothetical protein